MRRADAYTQWMEERMHAAATCARHVCGSDVGGTDLSETHDALERLSWCYGIVLLRQCQQDRSSLRACQAQLRLQRRIPFARSLLL
jgi:hypothetical protein